MEGYTDLTDDGNWIKLEIARTGTDVGPATATWTFTDKPNEGTTIKLTDYEGTEVIFEVDNDNDGASGENVAMDPASNSAAGMATILFFLC